MPDSLEIDVLNAKNYLNSQHITIHDEWLTGCVEFFREEQGSRPYNRQELNDMVKSQWLLGDLQDISPGCLPPDLSSQIKTSLSGVYLLQLNSLIDVGAPAYQQLQKIMKIDTANIEETDKSNKNSTFQEPSSQRMLKLKLTDGIQEISGIEYRPMRNLNTELTPGVKIQVKGPIDCRRGVLMLEEKHITVLGGEVDNILLVNQYKNVLSRIVEANAGLSSENAIPVATFTRDIYQPVRDSVDFNLLNQRNSTQINNDSTKKYSQLFNNQLSKPFPNSTNLSENAEIIDLDAEMFLDDDFDFNQIEAIEKQAVDLLNFNEEYTSPKNAAKKIKIFNDDADHAPAKVPVQLSDTSHKHGPNILTNQHSQRSSYPTNEDLTGIEDMDDFAEYYNEPSFETIQQGKNKNVFSVLDKNVNETKIEILKNDMSDAIPVKVSSSPYVYLKQLSEIPDERKLNKTFTIKAQVMKLNSKLSLQNHLWVLRCKLCDGSAYLDVDVSSEVLTQMVGYSPSEMTKMKSEMVQNPHLKQRMLDGLNNARHKLQNLDCLLLITYKSSGPCIVETIDFQHVHLSQLRDRHSFNHEKYLT